MQGKLKRSVARTKGMHVAECVGGDETMSSSTRTGSGAKASSRSARIVAGLPTRDWDLPLAQPIAVITSARMRPSTGPLPKRRVKASAAYLVASSNCLASRVSISFLTGVPWQ
jgi:hypothetical protein